MGNEPDRITTDTALSKRKLGMLNVATAATALTTWLGLSTHAAQPTHVTKHKTPDKDLTELEPAPDPPRNGP